MAWAGWAKSSPPPSAEALEFLAKFFKTIFGRKGREGKDVK